MSNELAVLGRLDDPLPVPEGYAELVLAACAQSSDWQSVNGARAALGAHIARYRALGRSAQELLKAERYTELRIGEFLKPYGLNGPKDEPPEGYGGLPYGAAWQFARLARYREQVLGWIEDGVLTRGQLLSKITEKEGSRQLPLLDTGPQYQLIYADPPWRYEHTETPRDRQIENQYPTMSQYELEHLEVPAAANSVLFMWATNPKLEEALALMKAWRFEYRTNMVWVKDRIGMGYYVRGAHELLLIGKRGTPTMPVPANRPKSWLQAARLKHSAKPPVFFGMIEMMYPDLSKLEMFARENRPGWDVWGYEAP